MNKNSPNAFDDAQPSAGLLPALDSAHRVDDELTETLKALAASIDALNSNDDQSRLASEDRFRLLVGMLASKKEKSQLPGVLSLDSRPVFVLGCVRSGTTVTTLALRAAGLSGWKEGHIFPLLSRIKQTIDQYFRDIEPVLGAGLAVDFFDRRSFEQMIVDYFERMHTASGLATRWVDKTPGPEMIEAAPHLLAIWPEAKFIFCRRRGIENVKSQVRRFKNDPKLSLEFEESCWLWSRCMESWLGVRHRLGDAFVEIDQADIAGDPDKVTERLAALLELSPVQSESVCRTLRDSNPENTASSYAGESLEETGWSDEQKQVFLTACGPMMKEYGYVLEVDAEKTPISTLFLPYTDDPEKVTVSNAETGKTYRPAEYGAFLLHPTWGRGPATLTFRSLLFRGHCRFVSSIEIRHRQSAPVVYRLRIRSCSGGELLLDERLVAGAGKVHKWEANFAPLQGLMDVSLSTEMAPDARNNFYAWAHWLTPRFVAN